MVILVFSTHRIGTSDIWHLGYLAPRNISTLIISTVLKLAPDVSFYLIMHIFHKICIFIISNLKKDDLGTGKSTGSGEPDISGMKVTSAGELPASKGADSTPVTKPDGPALSFLETREDVSKQIPSPANTEEEGTDDDIYSIHNDTSSSEQDSSGEGEDYSSEEESKDDIVPGVDQEKKEIAMMLKEMYAECVKLKATMDLTPEDSVLPIQAKKAVKVPANIIENSAVTRQYVTVKRKRKNLADPNSCKTT